MRTPGRRIFWAALVLALLVPMPAGAFELGGGLSMGAFLAGTVPRIAVSPNASLSWPMTGDFRFALHDLCSVLPPLDEDGSGFYNKTSAAIRYASENVMFSVGPSLSIYSIPACGRTLCGRVAGVAPGGFVQTEMYFAGPLGVSVSGNVDWVGGESLVLPGGVAVMVLAGPVLRWSAK